MITSIRDYDISKLTTFGLHCIADEVITATDPEADLPTLFNSGRLGPHTLIIGGGSNLLFTEPCYHGTILRIMPPGQPFRMLGEGRVDVSAAVTLNDFVYAMAEHGLWGAENLAGIPGTVGGATVQNAGAYGKEFGELVIAVRCFDRVTGRFTLLNPNECDYSYRHSLFKTSTAKGRYIITEVEVQLSTIPSPNLRYAALTNAIEPGADAITIANTVVDIRRTKLPEVSEVGSAGSFFRNPVVDTSHLPAISAAAGSEPSSHPTADGKAKLSAAWLIDQAGFKGVRHGDAATWPLQPLVLVNYGNATAADIINLENEIISGVSERFGVELQPEVEHIISPK